uniref:Putative secreted protein n=1 Tax=Anopheles marajoara TaxID=58244 RepID=A0A2M4C8H6_9DIPT
MCVCVCVCVCAFLQWRLCARRKNFFLHVRFSGTRNEIRARPALAPSRRINLNFLPFSPLARLIRILTLDSIPRWPSTVPHWNGAGAKMNFKYSWSEPLEVFLLYADRHR